MVEPLAAGEEGPGGRAVRAGQADHLLDRPQRAAEVPRRRSRDGHPRMEQGLREDRLQGRDRRQAAARRCRLRHARLGLCLGALADDRPMPGFGAIGPSMSTRAAARSSTPTSASRACSSRSLRTLRAQTLSRRRPSFAAVLGGHAEHARRMRIASTATWRPSSWAMRWTCWRRAASSTPTARRPSVRARLRQGHDDARGGACARACATTSAPRASTPSSSWPIRNSRASTAPPAR